MSRRWLVIVIVMLAAVYLAAVNDYWAVLRDTAMYLTLGHRSSRGTGWRSAGSRTGASRPWFRS